MSAPRVRPGTRAEVGRRTALLARAGGLIAGTEPPKLFLVLGRQRKLFRGWLRFAGRLMPRGTLPRRETELMILRIAHLRDCGYEWTHHVRLGRRAGVGEADVARLQVGPEDPGWSPRERLLLTAVDELHRDQDLSDDTWARLSAELDPPRLIELLLLVGHYEMLATTLNTLHVEPDEERPTPALVRRLAAPLLSRR